VFSSVIYHHASENPNITYGILQSRKIFEDLGTFTLARGLREVKRAQQAKEANNQANPKGKGPVDEVEMADAGAEKARLLENEGANRGDSTEGDDSSAHTSLGGEEVLTRPLMSPNTESPYSSVDSPVSEKARGKMRARRSLSTDTISSLDRAPLGIGKNGFVPTQEWVFIPFPSFVPKFLLMPCSGDILAARVRLFQLVNMCSTNDFRRLPLDTVMVFISDVIQKVEEMQRHNAVPSSAVIQFLSNIDLSHVLSSKAPTTARKFMVC